MATYDEILSFQQFDNNDAIETLVNMLPDKSLALNQLLKVACIQGHTNAVKFIYKQAIKQAIKQNIELDIHTAILLAVKNSHHEIIKHFISVEADTSSKEVIKKAIEFENDLIIYYLLIFNQYDKSTLKEIYDWALKNYSYKISKEIEARCPEFKKPLAVKEINQQLKELSNPYLTFTSDQVDFICDMVDKGGDISLLNESLILISLIADSEYESAAKLILKGVDPKKTTLGALLFIIDECWMEAKEFKEEVLDEFQDYMDKHHPDLDCMPECVTDKSYLKTN